MDQEQFPTSADTASANTVGTVASPLLAGFSVTLITLITGNESPEHLLKYPDITLAVLLIATISFVLAVQFTVASRVYNLSKQEYQNRTLNMKANDRAQAYAVVMSKLEKKIVQVRLAFNFGLITLFLGLAGILLPPYPSSIRTYIVCGLFIFLVCEVAWLVYAGLESYIFRRSLGKKQKAKSQ
ncbi:hypothetical protein OPS25_02140 [Alteromonas ponticola]|uniref:DUF2721 domain-containing protein n=1 Tax=Alteromonas aquimaris TaxID=2998417 RepID=A0ABT3P3F0_9ALTE|nr:hypothetical protein [Alteromonas aquimaris]MCW8107304.1 hypothetical protein [Alteromonas aquimaris]